jgi:hypothetical protein
VPSLAGVLVAAVNPGTAFLGAGLGYAVALLALPRLGRHAAAPGSGSESLPRQLGDGFATCSVTGRAGPVRG